MALHESPVAAPRQLSAVDEQQHNGEMPSLRDEIWSSMDSMFSSNRLTVLLVLGPVALVGRSLGALGEPACFAFAGLALIPCAERYVLVCSVGMKE